MPLFGRPTSASRPSSATKSSGQSSSPGARPSSGRPLREDGTHSRRDLDAMRTQSQKEADNSEAGAFSEAHLATLEDAIKDAVRMKRSASDDSKRMVEHIFKQVDDGDGEVDVREFCAVCGQVGLNVSPEEAKALFERYGYEGTMPLKLFIDKLVKQPNRQAGADMRVRNGPFQAGENAAFNGKIKYPKCRKAVYTPSDWDPELAERSAEQPDATLVLQYVYGYQGKENTAQNLFYTAENKLVYYIAGVGVVYSRPPDNSQSYFLGHNDDVMSLALCPASVEFNDETYPARTLVATGQITNPANGPYICVWDSRTCEYAPDCPAAATELVRLRFDKDARGITALAFSPCGKYLVAVATDNHHTVYVYDWANQKQLSVGKGMMGDPPQVYGVEWNPHPFVNDDTPPPFLTFGKKHIKQWSFVDPKSGWKPRQMAFSKLPIQTIASAQWLAPREGRESLVAAGASDGSIYIFKGGAGVKQVAAHGRGPQLSINGLPGYYGVHGLRLCKNNGVLISGGADGTVLQWDVSDGTLQEGRFVAEPVNIPSPFGPNSKWAPAIRSIDYSDDLDRIIVGTNNCDVKEIGPGSEVNVLMYGHSGDVYHLAWHPELPNIMVTASDSGHVHQWNTEERQMMRLACVGFTARAVAFSSKPVGFTGTYHIAVGGSKGQIKVLDEGRHFMPIFDCKDCVESVSDIKYAPNNRFMAAANWSQYVDIYNVEKGYTKVARCTGHSSTVRGIDWSLDSSIIMSNSADMELLYWNARTGKQILLDQRDTEWATYTCLIGFPVMGIWPPNSDGTDINSVDRSNNGKYLATVDDFGLVKLFNYPCVVDDAPYRAYRGHCSHVMGVRFNKDSNVVCSVGGKDWAIFQFRVAPVSDVPSPGPGQSRMRRASGANGAPGGGANEPKLVWGALDPQGKVFGYTTNPFPLP